MPVKPSSQMYLIDMFISPYVMVSGSIIPGLYLLLTLRHVSPDSKCHVISPHGITALLRAENSNRWLKCLQQDFPRHPGKCRVLPVVMGCNICSAKMPREEQYLYPPCPQKACYSAGCQLPLQRTICY